MRILILEDDEAILHLLKLMFCDESLGYECDTVMTIKDARQKLATNKYDMALVDLMIQGEACVSFIEEVRAVRPRIKVCVMSAWTGADKMIEGINVDGFLPKPFDLEIMDKTLFGIN